MQRGGLSVENTNGSLLEASLMTHVSKIWVPLGPYYEY